MLLSPRSTRATGRRFSWFERFAAGQIAEDEALDALGVGIERYATLELPTVLVEGDSSPVHLRVRLADLAATLPNVERIATLVSQGHVAQLTAPDLLAELIGDFARRVLH